jgi:hypothetical protein
MLESLGNLGDFLGGIGVLVTLVYLGIQVRQNTVASRSDSYQDAVTAVSEWSRHVGSDPELCRILNAGMNDYEALGQIDRTQFSFLLSAFFRNLESIHAKYASGQIGGDVWLGWANRVLAMLSTPGVSAWWTLNESAFDPQFRKTLAESKPTEPFPEVAGTISPPAA